MIRIKAIIKLYSDSRKTPFLSGYRPLFDFIEETKTSGQITLIDRKAFYLGDEGIVEIAFLHRKALGDDFLKVLNLPLEKDESLWEKERF